jgi:hypothetical protein
MFLVVSHMIHVKQGSAAEIISFLEERKDLHNQTLILIVPEAMQAESAALDTGQGEQVCSLDQIVWDNGVLTLPKRGLKEPVSPDLIKRLLEEDDD